MRSPHLVPVYLLLDLKPRSCWHSLALLPCVKIVGRMFHGSVHKLHASHSLCASQPHAHVSHEPQHQSHSTGEFGDYKLSMNYCRSTTHFMQLHVYSEDAYALSLPGFFLLVFFPAVNILHHHTLTTLFLMWEALKLNRIFYTIKAIKAQR